MLFDVLTFESAHSQRDSSGECSAIDIPKTFTKNVFLKSRRPSPPQGVDVAALEAGFAAPWPTFPGRCRALGVPVAAAAALGGGRSAGTPRLRRLRSAPLRTGAPRPPLSRPERLPQPGRDREPAGEAPSHRLKQFCCLLRPETWRCSPLTRLDLSPRFIRV